MKKHSTRIISILFIIFLLLGFGQVPGARATSPILYVAPASACSGTPNCYATVQAALDAAVTGNEIRVAQGVYTDMHDCPRNDIVTTGVAPAVVCLSKTVTIRGGYNNSFTSQDLETHPTTIDAAGLGRGIYITGAISPTVADLIITHGDATGLTGYGYYGEFDAGGGIYVMTADATLRDNRITTNTTPGNGGGGAGVYLGQSDSLLIDNTIELNTAGNNGAGGGVMIFQGAPSLIGNSINFNSGGNIGGGVYVFDSNAAITGNAFSTNSAVDYGGGIDVASCDPVLTGNKFYSNMAWMGAGASLYYSFSRLTNNVFIDNITSGNGSGLMVNGSQVTLFHNTFVRNTGGEGSAVYITDYQTGSSSTVTMTNSIVASQAVGISINATSLATLDGVLWYDNGANTSGAGTVNISHAYSGDPAFSLEDGYHLTSVSAAIDHGVNGGIQTDIDGEIRLGAPDLGADEYWPSDGPRRTFLPLVWR